MRRTAAAGDIAFVRLTEVSLAEIAAHMSSAKVAEHMPLLTPGWTVADAEAFVSAKEACWAKDGLGHWAILLDGVYVGWGGFQREGDEWDFGLVLKPEHFGLGLQVARKALAFAETDSRIPHVTFLLPLSRTRLAALARLGAVPVGEIDYEGVRFRKFRLETGGR